MPVHVIRRWTPRIRTAELHQMYSVGMCVDAEPAYRWIRAWWGGPLVGTDASVVPAPYPQPWRMGLTAVTAGGRPILLDAVYYHCLLTEIGTRRPGVRSVDWRG